MSGIRLFALLVCLGAAIPAADAARRDAVVANERPPGIPLVAVVGLKEQKITVYDSAGAIMRGSVSTGQQEYETPAGVFTILQKNRDHASNLYDAEMPFMQRLTWSGVALHAGRLPGYRASHGCIRLPYTFAERLFDLSSVGTRVVVAPRGTAATFVDHPVLDRLKKAGKGASPAGGADAARQEANLLLKGAEAVASRAAKAAADARRAQAAKTAVDKRLATAVKRNAGLKDGPAKARSDAELAKLRSDAAAKAAVAASTASIAAAVSAEQRAAEERAKLARLRAWPTSILVSLATKRLYVRQGFEPVLEVPISVREPNRAIGTHALYATEGAGGERGWMGVTLEGGKVQSALDRIVVPDEAAKLIARGQWLGSMLIVTDEAPHKETGAGTDFLVVLSDQPQGALKLRPRGQDPLVATSGQVPEGGIRAYRSVSDDAHFRHPLGAFP